VTDESTRYGVIQSTVHPPREKREREKKKNMRGLRGRLAEKNTVLEFFK
jgi:hypothetical protein